MPSFQPLKRRIPKSNAPPIEVTKVGQPNNGNIEVILPETASAPPPKLAIDEVLINGRRYRVPERVITMDFWNKTGKPYPQQHRYILSLQYYYLQSPNLECRHYDFHSAASSPLSSLSSLSDDDMRPVDYKPTGSALGSFDLDELKAVVVSNVFSRDDSFLSRVV